MVDYYNKQGLLLPNAVVWARLYEDADYRNLAVDVEQNFMVSTVWEGHERPAEGVGIFETGIVRDGQVVQRFRWRTMDEALKGHDRICQEALLREPRPEDGFRERIVELERRQQA